MNIYHRNMEACFETDHESFRRPSGRSLTNRLAVSSSRFEQLSEHRQPPPFGTFAWSNRLMGEIHLSW